LPKIADESYHVGLELLQPSVANAQTAVFFDKFRIRSFTCLAVFIAEPPGNFSRDFEYCVASMFLSADRSGVMTEISPWKSALLVANACSVLARPAVFFLHHYLGPPYLDLKLVYSFSSNKRRCNIKLFPQIKSARLLLLLLKFHPVSNKIM